MSLLGRVILGGAKPCMVPAAGQGMAAEGGSVRTGHQAFSLRSAQAAEASPSADCDCSALPAHHKLAIWVAGQGRGKSFGELCSTVCVFITPELNITLNRIWPEHEDIRGWRQFTMPEPNQAGNQTLRQTIQLLQQRLSPAAC